MVLSINQCCTNRQMNLSSAFVQANLAEDVYLAPLCYFDYDAGEERSKMVMKLNKSLY